MKLRDYAGEAVSAYRRDGSQNLEKHVARATKVSGVDQREAIAAIFDAEGANCDAEATAQEAAGRPENAVIARDEARQAHVAASTVRSMTRPGG